MRYKFSLIIVSCALLFAVACKHNVPQLAIYIPKDAAAVFVIDAKSIADKINSSGITLDSLANMLHKNRNSLHWNDIENSGIDITKPVFVFSKQSNAMQAGRMLSFGFIAEVLDKNKLINFLQKQTAGAAVKPGNKYQYIDLSNGYVAGFTDKVLIISGITSAEMKANEAQSHQQLNTLFAQSESNSVASIKAFNNALDKTGDIHFWLNSSAQLSSLPMLGMTKISDLFTDTYTSGTVDFENGKAVAETETHFNKTMSGILDKYNSKEINKDLIKHYPQPVTGFGIIAFNPKVLLDILHYAGFDMMTDGYTSNLGFTTNDVANAFSGDMAVIFSDVKVNEQAVPQTPAHSAKATSTFLFNALIGDKTAFNKIINGLVNKNVLSKNGDLYQLGFFGGNNFIIKVSGNNFLIASDDAIIRNYESGNTSSLPADVEKNISNKSSAMYFDIAAMLQRTNSADTSAVKITQAAQATFKNVMALTDKSDGKTITANFELNFVHANENSLASLVKFMAVTHEADMKRNSSWNDDDRSNSADSLSKNSDQNNQ